MASLASRPLAAACAATQNAPALARVGSAVADALVGPETARSRPAGRFCRQCSVQHAGLEFQGATCWLAPTWMGSAPSRGPARVSAPGLRATATGLNPFTPPAKGGVKAEPPINCTAQGWLGLLHLTERIGPIDPTARKMLHPSTNGLTLDWPGPKPRPLLGAAPRGPVEDTIHLPVQGRANPVQ